jgi:Tol biopolymer transport system component/tRNA A-37 threonylcarbamoyl transferase component Bud32
VNREQWERVQELFLQAQECAPDERSAFLRRLADREPTLHGEVASLLASSEHEGILDGFGKGDEDAQAQFERLSRALADRYALESEAGRGGMAMVYRARDLKHHRSVAIKVLHPLLAHSIGTDRFLTEIATTAALQHPHILPLFDSGEADGFLFFVMPFVEGESLRERLDRERQLPVSDAVRMATRMAEALDYAHRRGIIHRDIKPGNVLLQDGQPTISDFGIALAVGAAADDRLTGPGYGLGTPRYMSPEQISGDQPIGPPTDVYALGCVLYQMLVGDTPFGGESLDSVQRKLSSGPAPSPGAVRRSIPANVDAAIRKALERLPADRFQSAGDFAAALSDPTFRHGERPTSEASGKWRVAALVLAGLLAIVSIVATVGLLRPDPAGPVQRFTLTPGNASGMIDPYVGVGVALSPSGDRLVYVGVGQEGQQLWLRSLDALDPTPIPWTDGAENPVFSPDGTSVVFRDGDDLETISLLGGLPTVLLSEGVTGRYVDWGDDGFIYFASDSAIARIPAVGGEPERVTTPFPGARIRLPRALPDGRGLLVTLRRDAAAQATIGVVGPEGGEVRELLPGVSARYAISGHLVYATPDGTLMAAPFDLGRLEVTGESVAVLEGLDVRIPGLGAQFDLTEGGALVYRTAAATDLRRVVWVDRTGGTTPIDPQWTFRADVDGSSLALSPNGDRLLVSLPRGIGGGWDLWMKSLVTGALERLTTEGIENRRPSWSADGEWVTYIHGGAGGDEVRRRRASGGPASTVDVGPLGGSAPNEVLVSASGEWLVVRAGSTDDGSDPDIFGLRIGVDSVAQELVAGEHVEWAPALSPDGRWLAYASDETGRTEVYARPFPDVERRAVRISTAGGDNPVWSREGQELYYRDASDQLIAVTLRLQPDFSVIRRTALFSAAGFLRGDGHPMYDVEPGGRFLMLESAPSRGSSELILVQNWLEELKAPVVR